MFFRVFVSIKENGIRLQKNRTVSTSLVITLSGKLVPITFLTESLQNKKVYLENTSDCLSAQIISIDCLEKLSTDRALVFIESIDGLEGFNFSYGVDLMFLFPSFLHEKKMEIEKQRIKKTFTGRFI